jgi:hypothetical protein
VLGGLNVNSQWIRKKVLVTVRTYPTPAWKGVEVSCTAGITDDLQWIRLFPIPYRFLSYDKRFRKYQWIELEAKKSSDHRPESFEVNIDSIRILSDPLPTDCSWKARKEILLPLKAPSLCSLKALRDANGAPTLGLFRPKRIRGFEIKDSETEWTPEQKARLQQTSFFDTKPREELEKIPYVFSYTFDCDEPGCSGHTLSCTDWEMGESYRKWTKTYGSRWERSFKDKYETEMILAKDTHFFVGTLHEYPGTWIIVGLFYPSHEQ